MSAVLRSSLPLAAALLMAGCASLAPPLPPAQAVIPAAAPVPDLPPGPEYFAIADLEHLVTPVTPCNDQHEPHLYVEWDLWQRIRGGFGMSAEGHERVQAELRWYADNQPYLDRVADRAEPYLHYIVEEIERRGLPSEIALLPIVESAFQPFAYSAGRAAGIWQFIPSTGRLFDLDQNWWYDGRRDIVASTNAALDYLQKLNGYFDGDWLLALAGYNAGAGNVMRAVRRNEKRGLATDFWSLDLPRETRSYVPRLLALRRLVARPDEHGIELRPIDDTEYFQTVELDSQIDLAMAAELAGIPIDELYRLNPGYNRWATAPEGPHRLVLPIENAERFAAELALVPRDELVSWRRHRIRPGETLGQIAARYRTTVRVLQQVNGVRGHVIRAGDHLLIPVASQPKAAYALSAEQRLKRLQETPRGEHKIVHEVAAGDTLWDLSRRYGVSVHRLAKWNGLAPRDTLFPGQSLVIWQRAGARKAAYPVQSPREGRIQRVEYTVRRGDSLARIAARFRVQVSDLQRWNGLDPKKYLQPGQRITLFVDVTRQSGNV